MPLEVNLEVSFSSETTPTHIALKGALTCMRPDMYLQCRVAAEYLPAVAAPVLKERLIPASRLGVIGRQGVGFASALPERQLVREIVGQQTLTRILQYLLGPSLKHL